MEHWFTLEAIDESTFAISEYRHWEETHCYLLLGAAQAMLIDTGLGVSDIRAEVRRLTALPVLVVTTHAHWDHIGGHRLFDNIAVHEAEKSWLSGKFPLPLAAVKRNLMREPCAFPAGFRPEAYSIFQGTPRQLLHDGMRIDLGGRTVMVLHTPGHSPGHCCFHEPERKYLYTGDLVYRGCLDAFYPTTDPQLFFQSVQKIQALEVRRILPGHHALDISPALIDSVEAGFRRLARENRLAQGQGLFDFGEFQIHL